MMLKDSLSNLISSQSTNKECKFGKLIKSLDEETVKILISAMAGDVSTMDLVRTLRSEGHPFSREFLGVKRNCFKDNDSAKSCCVSELMKKLNLYPEDGR